MKNKEALIELYQLPEKELTEIKSRQNGHIDHIALMYMILTAVSGF